MAKPLTGTKNTRKRKSLRAWFVGLPLTIKGALIAGIFALVAAMVGGFITTLPSLLHYLSRNGAQASGDVRIIRLLPHPQGDQAQNEEATIRNYSPKPVSLKGWKLRDSTGRFWLLDEMGTLASAGEQGDQKTIQRHGQAMAMNDDGDTIQLEDVTGKVIHSVTYQKVKAGKEIIP
jgi:hypothetical protein